MANNLRKFADDTTYSAACDGNTTLVTGVTKAHF